MTTDQDLLIAAARAAGKDLAQASWGGSLDGFYWVIDDQPGRVEYWNPLRDDGDCARLEAACGLDVTWVDIGVASGAHREPVQEFELYSAHSGDRQAARRMASTRAAAALGKEQHDGS